VRKKSVRRAEPGRNPGDNPKPWEVEFDCNLPDVPVLPETLLRFELEIQEPCVDLRAMSQLVLSDLGATLQILRLSGSVYDDAENRPTRIEDCISDLGLDACLGAVSAQTVARDGCYQAIMGTWAHSREIAQHARLAAEEMPDVNPEDAYLVGLLHAIGLLPQILGWSGDPTGKLDGNLVGFQMARQWRLPPFVVEFFSAMQRAGCDPRRPQIVTSAHRSASRSSIHCPFERGLRPLLHRAV